MSVVVKNCAYILAHIPDFIRYGSRPYRDICINGSDQNDLEEKISYSLRSFDDIVSYPPNQVYIGNMKPDQLNEIPAPWFENPIKDAHRQGKLGGIMSEQEFYAWLKIADDFDLIWLTPDFSNRLRDSISNSPFLRSDDIEKLGDGVPIQRINRKIEDGSAKPLFFKNAIIGAVRRDHDKDDTLKAIVLLENLMTKASGALAVHHLLGQSGYKAEDIDFILSCSEEAVGDRYNRGGGSLSKAIGEMCHCANASGHDIKAFCVAPIHALLDAACQVEAGLFESVVVVGGGCLAKAGMKYRAHLKKKMPVLEDVLAGFAFLITRDDGQSPILRLDCVGKHDISSGSNQQDLITSLIVKPLDKLGLKMIDIDKYATELHNPEITVPAGSGNTPLTNYRLMGALAAFRKEIKQEEIDAFVKKHGMPGFTPTQGHIPSAVPFMGHAIEEMKRGKMKNALFVGKGSLFLGRMTQLSDGMSFLLTKNQQ